jgi:hypothetical protein
VTVARGRRITSIALLLLGLATVVVGLAACGRSWSDPGALGETFDDDPRPLLEGWTGVRLPESAAALRSQRRLVMTARTVLVRFEIALSALPGVLQGSPFAAPAPGPFPALLKVGDPPPWWTPDRAGHPLVSAAPGRALLVDATDPARAVVYVLATSR